MYLRAIVETSQCFIYKGTFAPALKVKKNSYKEDEQLDMRQAILQLLLRTMRNCVFSAY